MDLKDLQFFKTLLLDKRKEILKQIEVVKETGMESTIKESAGDISAYGFHLADHGSDSNECEKNFLNVQRDGQLLYDIDSALEKIEQGTFGLCEKCGHPINKSRLEAIPYASLCIECKAKEEKLFVEHSDSREYLLNNRSNQEEY